MFLFLLANEEYADAEKYYENILNFDRKNISQRLQNQSEQKKDLLWS